MLHVFWLLWCRKIKWVSESKCEFIMRSVIHTQFLYLNLFHTEVPVNHFPKIYAKIFSPLFFFQGFNFFFKHSVLMVAVAYLKHRLWCNYNKTWYGHGIVLMNLVMNLIVRLQIIVAVIIVWEMSLMWTGQSHLIAPKHGNGSTQVDRVILRQELKGNLGQMMTLKPFLPRLRGRSSYQQRTRPCGRVWRRWGRRSRDNRRSWSAWWWMVSFIICQIWNFLVIVEG